MCGWWEKGAVVVGGGLSVDGSGKGVLTSLLHHGLRPSFLILAGFHEISLE